MPQSEATGQVGVETVLVVVVQPAAQLTVAMLSIRKNERNFTGAFRDV
jgi:hypothetical protein